MYNWSVDTKFLAKYPQKYKIWQLEQRLSYGLGGRKIEKKEVVKNWDFLKNRLDPKRRRFLEFLIWGKLS